MLGRAQITEAMQINVFKKPLRTCVLPLLSYHLKFHLALQQCEKMSNQCPTQNSFASLKVTTGGRRHAAIDAESDRVSSLCGSTSTSWSSHDSITLLIDTISTIITISTLQAYA